ncbi:hypothetical protein GCM10007937_60250 [Mesorhizobium albiziae]|nr:hypothetical protein GCM10007937_60250 [Mesorhizobium albiziae]
MLGADPPLVLGLVAFGKIADELVDALDGPEIGRVTRHEILRPPEWWREMDEMSVANQAKNPDRGFNKD